MISCFFKIRFLVVWNNKYIFVLFIIIIIIVIINNNNNKKFSSPLRLNEEKEIKERERVFTASSNYNIFVDDHACDDTEREKENVKSYF